MLVAGFVLVGGRSTRMGRDKARLPIASHLLVDEVAAQVREVAQNIALIGESARYRDLPYDCLNDLRPHAGPLAGIETALASNRGDVNLIVACDMPDLRREWLADLVRQAIARRTRCLVCRDATGRIHPLCGVWSAACLPIVKHALDEQRLRLHDLLDEIPADYLPIDHPIPNLNTPAEWHDWQQRAETCATNLTTAAVDGR